MQKMKIYEGEPVIYFDETLAKKVLVYVEIGGVVEDRKYVGEAQLQTPNGVMPFNFDITATGIEDAFEQYDAVFEHELNELKRKMETAHTEQQNRIITPNNGGLVI